MLGGVYFRVVVLLLLLLVLVDDCLDADVDVLGEGCGVEDLATGADLLVCGGGVS